MTALRLFSPSLEPEQPTPPTSAALTVRDIIDLYLRHSAAEGVHVAEALDDRRRTLGLFADLHGDLAVSAARPYHLRDFISDHPTWKSVSTRRSKANEIRAAFQWAANDERIGRNPFHGVTYAEAERRPEMPDAVIDRVAALANKPFERALRFLRLTGCRLGELSRARRADVDLEGGVWVIPKHKNLKRTRKAKVVALVPDAVELLRSIFALAPDAAPDSLIFVNTIGTEWNRRTLGQQLGRMKKRHGITTKASLHGIRHRAASAAIAAGAPIKLVAAQLGHASQATTERYYCHLEDQMDAIRAAIGKGVPTKQ